MPAPEPRPLVTAIEAGEPVAYAELSSLSTGDRELLRSRLLATPTGRRWLRADPDLTPIDAGRLLEHEPDFRQSRRDRTLAAVIKQASSAAIERHLDAIAAGPGAPELWRRLAGEPDQLVSLASALVAGDDRQAADATLYLLVLDPLDPFEVGEDRRAQIAAAALSSPLAGARGLAAEYLAEHDPAVLRSSLDRLVMDESQRVRGVAWQAALRVDRRGTAERAVSLLSDESTSVLVRRSALDALGTALPTSQLAELLAHFVVHPDHDLAADAAGLLYRQHRNPITAEAARASPHPDVREIAERLLDPSRGSPAAGGSRPGDPTRSSTNIYADMIRQLEERSGNQNEPDGR